MEGLLAQVKKDTRGVLLSRIGGVPLEGFNRDYRELLGNRFPYRDLGFPDLRSCLESMDDTVRFEFANDKWMLFGVADDHSFMSSPAIKAQFTQDKPVNRRGRRRRNGKKKSSDSDDSTGQGRSKKSISSAQKSTPRPMVNGESSKIDELVPNMKGLYSVCLQNQPPEKTQVYNTTGKITILGFFHLEHSKNNKNSGVFRQFRVRMQILRAVFFPQ